MPFSFLIRNTAAILWFPPLLWILFNRPRLVPYFFATTIPLFLFSLVNDYLFYERWLIPFFQFATFDHGQFWHENPLFFVVVATPAFMSLLTPVFALGGYQYYQERKALGQFPVLLSIPALYIVFYSCNPHKEIRFILPIVPIFTYLAAKVLKDMLG